MFVKLPVKIKIVWEICPEKSIFCVKLTEKVKFS